MQHTQELRPKIRAILHELMITVPDDETDLVATAALDSLSLVNLIMELETQFAITIDFDTLELESFRSVSSMSSYLSSLLTKQPYLANPIFPLKPQNTVHTPFQKT